MAQHTSTTSGSKGRRGVFRSMFLIWQNLIGALLSVPVLVTGILIAKEHRGDGEDCATFMDNPIIAMGALLLFVSLVGLVVAIFDRKFKLRHPLVALFHLLLMFFLVILLFCFAIFSLEITNKDLAHTVNGYGQSYKEYRLNEYPKWMRHRVEDARYWSKVKFCLQESSVCKAGILPNIFSNITHVSLAKLKPIQRGCCIPPSACNVTYLGFSITKKANGEEAHFSNQHDVETKRTKGIDISTTPSTINTTSKENYHNTTKLSKTTLEDTIGTTEKRTSQNDMDKIVHAYIHDCKYWSALPQQLCFDCDTCRAGALQDSMDRWKKAAILYVVLVMIMILSYALFACYLWLQRKINTNMVAIACIICMLWLQRKINTNIVGST